ncbi:hypothetical protein ACO0RG_002706 [Hanseniaspora osmophila]|uniref:Gluconokinase n=1 Tax=Hanseniaspora osmophila TaxID=56408 RepID=A0A1E5R7R1_9ASCO|nr:putative gluconokinase [Hanseniaspora osmophila]
MERPTVVVIGGTAGTGKSTVADSLVGLLRLKYPSAEFLEGDSLHPPANVAKMTAGVPLHDEDRWGWLEKVSEESTANAKKNDGISIITCSALKKKYREYISNHSKETTFFFIMIYASKEEIKKRLTRREGHFMKANMLESQFADLELPMSIEQEPESRVITVDGRLQNHVLLNVFQMAFDLLKFRPLEVQIWEIFHLYRDETHPDGRDADFQGVHVDLIINELSWVHVASLKNELRKMREAGKLCNPDGAGQYYVVNKA